MATPSPAGGPLHVLLPTLGSAGDVHPMVALGLALRARGHRATLITNPLFAPLAERVGLDFRPLGNVASARAAIANPQLWHARRGLSYVLELIAPAMGELYELIEREADARTVVAASTLALGARVAQEHLGIPTATVHLQPSVLRSRHDSGWAGRVRLSARQPGWVKQAFFWLVDRLVIDRYLAVPLNELRAHLGMAPIERVFDRWLHSPLCVIGLFPEWFATPQPDWPPHTHLVGFVQWDTDDPEDQWARIRGFVQAAEPPVVITPGSAAATRQRYFTESLLALHALGRRAVLVTNFPEQLPARLPAGIVVCAYVPFSQLLPHAGLLVHHAGIGTLAQAIRAGVPQLLVPAAFDQFDNAARVQQLGLGAVLPATRYVGHRALPIMRELLADAVLRRRCQGYAARLADHAAVEAACRLIEELPAAAAAGDRGAAL
jgi:rhamnosyltransferase subunit B